MITKINKIKNVNNRSFTSKIIKSVRSLSMIEVSSIMVNVHVT